MHLAFRSAALAISAFAVMTSAYAQSPPVTLRFTSAAPVKTPWNMQSERNKAHVAEESKGSVVFDLFPGAVLGGEQDTLNQVVRGRIDAGGFSATGMSVLIPELAIFTMPFYFESLVERDCTIDALVPDVSAMLDAKGLKFLGWSEVGTNDVVGKKPLLLPTDVRGMKAVANQHRISALTWTTLGANPNPLPITEIMSAFQTGMVEVQAPVVTYYVPSGVNKIAPVLTRLDLSNSPGITLINKGVFEKLDAEQRSAIERAYARTPAAQMRKEIRDFEQVLRDMHVKGGGQVVQATPEQRDAWRKALQPAWPEMIKSVGGEAFVAKIDAARAKCPKS